MLGLLGHAATSRSSTLTVIFPFPRARGRGGARSRSTARSPPPSPTRTAAADVARDASVRYAYPAGYLARYFERLRYRFGARERQGLGRFFTMAYENGVLDAVPELRFAGTEVMR